ncbi:MAG: hypothetical protein LBF70_00775 [Holosporales bacterium]|nr:hypothetical protein [Holosporales bacterium]
MQEKGARIPMERIESLFLKYPKLSPYINIESIILIIILKLKIYCKMQKKCRLMIFVCYRLIEIILI